MSAVPKIGWWATAVVVAFVIASISSLLSHFSLDLLSEFWNDAYFRHVAFFSFYQALFSTLLSVFPAVPVSLALYRRRFYGRNLLLKLCSITLVLPVLVGVFGIMAIYGNSGLLKHWLSHWDVIRHFSIYGLSGILLAHVFFNLPYASRLLLQILETIPVEQNQLAAHLGMSAWQRFRWVEWPRLQQSLVPVAGLVFMLCFTSFATVMTLGGGPKSTTIELAIYQSIKFDFDLTTGAILAIAQMAFCGGLYFLFQRNSKNLSVEIETPDRQAPLVKPGVRLLVWDSVWLVVLGWIIVPPLIAVLVWGINPQSISVLVQADFWHAIALSVAIAFCAGVVATLFGYFIVVTSRALKLKERRKTADGVELLGSLVLITPSLVISTGLFLLLRRFADVYSFSFFIVVLVNSLMALPFVIKILSPPMWLAEKQYSLLCASLGIKNWNKFYLVDVKAIKPALVYAFSLSFLLSLGDLTAISMFGSQDFQTLPMYLYRLLGSYQMDAAAVVALSMMLFSLFFFALFERVSRLSCIR